MNNYLEELLELPAEERCYERFKSTIIEKEEATLEGRNKRGALSKVSKNLFQTKLAIQQDKEMSISEKRELLRFLTTVGGLIGRELLDRVKRQSGELRSV